MLPTSTSGGIFGDHHVRAARGLGAAEGGVGSAETLLGLVAVGGEHGNPARKARRRDRLLLVLDVELGGGDTELLDPTETVLGGGLGEDEHELLAAVAADHVRGAQARSQKPAE